jgi:serine/threonine protein kinase/Tfp pilus assembly protein PilF
MPAHNVPETSLDHALTLHLVESSNDVLDAHHLFMIPGGSMSERRAGSALERPVYSSVFMTKQISHYDLGEKLGTGGMGVVYQATDRRLGRPVALKFLSDSLGDDELIRRRFMQEARAASSLDHPNICTIFEIDEAGDGEMFIAMAFYPGETLNRIIARGPLPTEKALTIATQVARGLAAAHDELIIHRDIKPGNIMVTDKDTVKILDFGLAKLARHSGLTRPDSTLGTPGYMSPEQIRSDNVDHRTDIWALGVVLFEMLTGRLPFKGERTESLIHSILSDEPARVTSLRTGLPPRIDKVLQKALSKDPRRRYEKMSELIADLQALSSEAGSGEVTVQRPAAPKRRSVAVLPFVDMSPHKDQEYFCDGIAEELLSALSRIQELHVASRTSAFQFKGTAMDVRDIGEKLDVGTVLEGSVRKAGDRVRVTARLVNVSDGYRLWTEQYDRDMKDIFAIQDEIAQSIANALEVALGPEQQSPIEKAKPKDVEAYDFYLQGRQLFHQLRRKPLELARQMFSRAIEIDPEYARAYAGLADCSSYLRLYFGAGDEAVEEAKRATLKALELDPDLAEARVSRGFALSLTKDYEEAERELRKAIELNPSLFEAHYIAARVYYAQGRYSDAARHFARARDISPEAYDSWYFLASCYRAMGESDKVRTATLETVEAAKRRLSTHPDETRAWTLGAAALADLGEPEKAAEWIARALAIDSDEPVIQYNAACTYAGLRKVDEAIRCLEKATGMGFVSKEWIENDSDLDPLRDDPRFQQLLAGLD